MAAGRLLVLLALVGQLAYAAAQEPSTFNRWKCRGSNAGTAAAPRTFKCVVDGCGNPTVLFDTSCGGTVPATGTPLTGLITGARVYKGRKCWGHGRHLSQTGQTFNRPIGRVEFYYSQNGGFNNVLAASCGSNRRGVGRRYSFTCNGATGLSSITASCARNGVGFSFGGFSSQNTNGGFGPTPAPSPSPKPSTSPFPSPSPSPSVYSRPPPPPYSSTGR